MPLWSRLGLNNKIEQFWARLKHWLRKTAEQFEEFWDAVDNALNLCPN